MALDEDTSALIGRIYEAADDSAKWETILHDIRARMGARCLMHSMSDLRHGQMQRSIVIGDPKRPQGADEYTAHAFELDASFRWASKHPHARFCDTEELLPHDDYLQHEFIRWNRDEWIGSTHWLVGYTNPADELTFGLSVHPWAHDGPLSPDKKALFRMLFEHMERALRLASRPPILASADDALVLLDRSGHVLKLSPAAEDLLAAADGLTVWDQKLHADDSLSSQRLNTAIASALHALDEGGFGGAVAVARPSGSRDFLLTATPLLNDRSPLDAFRASVLVRIVDPERRPPPAAAKAWSDMSGMTPAETRLATLLLGDAENLRSVAAALGVTYATVRVHLRAIMDKTQTHSQSQLVHLLSRVI